MVWQELSPFLKCSILDWDAATMILWWVMLFSVGTAFLLLKTSSQSEILMDTEDV